MLHRHWAWHQGYSEEPAVSSVAWEGSPCRECHELFSKGWMSRLKVNCMLNLIARILWQASPDAPILREVMLAKLPVFLFSTTQILSATETNPDFDWKGLCAQAIPKAAGQSDFPPLLIRSHISKQRVLQHQVLQLGQSKRASGNIEPNMLDLDMSLSCNNSNWSMQLETHWVSSLKDVISLANASLWIL